MLTPVHSRLLTHYYPLGNTTATCLTQALPPEKKATVLLLGCGDARSILFTAHCDGRPMDISCCDIEPAILARNILLLSLILDDTTGQLCHENWSIYYHLYLSPEHLQRVRTQASKLIDLATSMETWQSGEYSLRMTFLDRGSMEAIRKIWEFWVSGTDDSQMHEFESSFKASLNRVMSTKMNRHAEGIFMSGIRSATPVVTAEIMKDQTEMHSHFWLYGTTDTDRATMAKATRCNPMFAVPDATVVLHHGSDPLVGFHNSLAYAPLTSSVPQAPGDLKHLHRLVASARDELSAWSASFRQLPEGSFILRCFTGDAVAFCHTLQSRRTSGVSTAGWFRTSVRMELVTLEENISFPGSAAPHSFNVIDTSNLSDHIGALNLLVAASPLLENDLASTLYTEVLAPQETSRRGLVDGMFCGHFTTMSMLLGLFPVDYWTNTLSSPVADDAFMLIATDTSTYPSLGSPPFVRISWKRPKAGDTGDFPQAVSGIRPLRFDADELAVFLHGVYENMFVSENLSVVFQDGDFSTARLRKTFLTFYRRPSFASFLKFVKTRVVGDFDQAMVKLLDMIEKSTHIALSGNYIQELYVYMHLLDVHSVNILRIRYNTTPVTTVFGDVRDWTDMPPTVCVTVKVPRESIAVFTEGPATNTPTLHCAIQNAGSENRPDSWQSIFSAVQLAFGNISTSGQRHSDDFKVNVAEDPEGWHGRAPVAVSFMVSTLTLLQDPREARVIFGVLSTPLLPERLVDQLGPELTIFETVLGDTERVFVSKYPPGQAKTLSVPGLCAEDMEKTDHQNLDVETTVRLGFHSINMDGVSYFTGRLDIRSDHLKSQLKNGCEVRTTAVSPFTFDVFIGEHSLSLDFPLPVVSLQCKARVSRRSSFVELIVPINAAVDRKPFRSFTYPVFTSLGIPTSWNLPYLKLDALPIFDIAKKDKFTWLQVNAGLMFSCRERRILSDASQDGSDQEHVRTNFKMTLLKLYKLFSREQRVFGLCNPTKGGVNIIILVSAMRLDLSNRTVVLDVALLPLYTDLMPQLGTFPGDVVNHSFTWLEVDEAEMRLWKQVLPAYVERCRTWSHKDTCEYAVQGKIPLSEEMGEELLCSCGKGVFPDDFHVDAPNWKDVSKHAVRGVISVAYCCPLADDIYNDGEGSSVVAKDKCRVCRRETREDGGDLRGCSRCRMVKYCSQKCQKKDWKLHRGWCAKK